MKKAIVLAVLLGLDGFARAIPAAAADPAGVTPPPEFLTSVPMAGAPEPKNSARETVKVVDGSTFDVVAPVFNGSDGNLSYLRLANFSGSTVNFTITIVGTPSGFNYGTATYSIPENGSQQYSYTEILDRAGVGALIGGDSSVSFYMRNGRDLTAYQHVIFNPTTRFFENASQCTYAEDLVYPVLNQVVINAHTSTLASFGFPTTVYVHNYGDTASSYNVFVADARTGVIKGSFVMNVGANTSFAFPFSYFQQQVGWVPGENEFHANLGFTAVGSNPYRLKVGQAVINQTLQAYVNMSLICPSNF